MDFSTTPPDHVVPSLAILNQARSTLISSLPERGQGLQSTQHHLDSDIVPALNQAAQSPHYYGFVTGGATPAAAFADHLVTRHDQNVHVHLPKETIVTDVEDAALRMVTDLLRLSPSEWPHRTFTTGATGSNILGLACGREFIVREAARQAGIDASIAEHGIVGAMEMANLRTIQILTTVAHSSLRKAASIVGLGRASVIDVSLHDAPHRFDMNALRQALVTPHAASIIVVSCSEVNTGLFATDLDDFRLLRSLASSHSAWIHVDAAFGLLARILSPDDVHYQTITSGVAGLELADSITGDAHKLLNVPYDCGIFLSRHLDIGTAVFQNAGAAYLASATTSGNATTIPSPLHIGLENSRRFRALPVYATLAAYGRSGYRDMLQRQIALSRAIAAHLRASDTYQLLPVGEQDPTLQQIYIIVLFRARDPAINADLVQRINASRRIYVSGTQWEGRPAARFAVSNWQADVERDLPVIVDVLDQASR